MNNILYGCKLVCKIATGIYAGNELYCTLVEQPARLDCGTNAGISHWRKMYSKAAALTTSLSVVSFSSAFGAYYYLNDNNWLAAGLIMLSILPYSYFAQSTTNYALEDPSLEKESVAAKNLLERWGRIQALKALMGFVALVLINIEA